MPDSVVRETYCVEGMVCDACEKRIAKRLRAEAGVERAKADIASATLEIAYDPRQVDADRLGRILGDMGYTLGPAKPADGQQRPAGGLARSAGLILAVLGLYVLGNRYGLLDFLNIFPEAEAGMGYGMVFIVGVLTSAHCLAMCGGINLSQTALHHGGAAGRSVATPSILYGLGRTLSYTAIGAAVGGVGSLATFSVGVKGLIQIVAGVFMLIMGLNLLGLFPRLRRLLPRLPGFVPRDGARRGPFFVGLLNGLMPCGPLQTMQVYALSTGSPVEGGLAMLFFALGTLPLTMGLGIAGSLLGRRFMAATIRVGAALVLVMGLITLGNGLRLSGFATPSFADAGDVARATLADGVQTVRTQLASGAYQAIRVRNGIPLRWTITAAEGTLNGCNNRIFVPEFHIEKRLELGDNLIEFTPHGDGVFPFMCWMGMISSRIIVGDAADPGTTPYFDPAGLPGSDADMESDVPW